MKTNMKKRIALLTAMAISMTAVTNIEKKITAGRNIGKIKGIAVIRDKANSREI